MPRLAANISLMFTEHALLDRIAAAADVGFAGVEILRPYDEDPAAIRAALERAGIGCTLINTPFGPDEGGHFGLAGLPGREADFDANLGQALAAATAIGCPRVHVLSGVVPDGADAAAHRATLVANLRRGAARAAEAGITLHIEPLNRFDFPGYLLVGQAMGHEIVDEVGAANLKVQFDLYHTQMAEGFVSERMDRFAGRFGYVQFAGVPGRHEPDHGELNVAFLLDRLDAQGYDGWAGAEYRPRAGTREGLGWAKRYGIG